MNQVAVIDYGMGNLHSVAKAIEHVGAHLASESGEATEVVITSDSALPGLEELVDRGPVLSKDFVIIL